MATKAQEELKAASKDFRKWADLHDRPDLTAEEHDKYHKEVMRAWERLTNARAHVAAEQ